MINRLPTETEIATTPMPYKGRSHREQLQDLVNDEVEARRKVEQDSNADEAFPGDGNNATAPTPEEETFKKRYGDLRRHSQKQAEDLKREIEALKRQLEETAHSAFKLPKTKEEVEAWVKTNPDVAAIVETISINKANEAFERSTTRIKQLEQDALEARIARAEEVMRRLHPDFDKLRESQDLHDWAVEQPAQIQAWLYDNPDNPDLCSRALDLYKVDRGIKAKKVVDQNKSDLEASRLVSPSKSQSEPTNGKEGKVFKESEILKMNERQFDAMADEIDKAQKEGRMIYDISGKR